MKAILNLTKVKDVKLHGVEPATPRFLTLIVHYYEDEPDFEYQVNVLDFCDESKQHYKDKIEKTYNDIKQALLKDEKYVEIEL